MKRTLTIAVLFWLVAVPAAAASHVRVVLDLSQSMDRKDQGRMALLSTVLLHDLARPNSTLGDSFEVIPFAPNWSWPDPDAPPPKNNGLRQRAVFGQRDDFVRRISGLPYNAAMTYFYPGLLEAAGDLERTPGGATDIRTIVLVTDGLPEEPTRERELELIKSQIVPRLEQGGIRLYILAFGDVADQNRDFFGQITRTSGGVQLGEYFVDPRGEELLNYMMQIFSRSFGYSVAPPQRLPGVSRLDLEGSTTPERVAVVVLSDRPQPLPSLRLTPPAGGAVNAPEGVRSADARSGSYSLLWVLQPHAGTFGLDTDALRGTVAVLRPTRLTLEILPVPPRRQTERAIARTPFPLRIRVKSPTGAQGDPGPVDLSFRTLGERYRNPQTGRTDYRWKSDLGAPPAGPGTRTSEGRVWDIMAEFQEHPERPNERYVGFIEVEARRGEAVVGSLVADQAHRVEVHPLLAIAPVPLSSYAVKDGTAGQGLRRRDEGCSTIAFEVTAGQLPHPDKPRYTVRAVLAPADPALLDRELRKASFTLDGLPLDIDGQPAPQPAAWTSGRTLDGPELLGQHTLCVRVGKPLAGNPGAEIPLVLTLLEDPYDDFGVIRPHTLKVSVAPPTFIEKWKGLLLGALTLLGLLALLWYARARPEVPHDLGYAVGREDAPMPSLVSQPLEERSLWSRLLGLTAERPVLAPAEDRLLGRVRPTDAELFQLRPARGVRVEPVDREEAIPLRRGLATLAVHRLYRLRTDRGAYLFRLEYR